MLRIFALILLQISLFATDFDCVIIGSSPFSLFEALYQYHSGKKVLILEEADECGGAWKGIDICGIKHADLGCHQIGQDLKLKKFLEEYAECKIVSLDNPSLPFESAPGPNGWYFSRGCYELIENLLKMIAHTDIALLTNTRAENVLLKPSEKTAVIETKTKSYSTKKIIVTPMTSLNIQGSPFPKNFSKSKHYHLYMLIQDPTPPSFTYHTGIGNGSSRMMNLTPFVGLEGTGRQLIVIQTYNEQYLTQDQLFLERLKSSNLVDISAYILQSDSYIYESGTFHQGLISSMGAQDIIEILQTGHFQTLSSYIQRWEMVLKPLHD
jgi:hypothetical protein